MGMNTAAASAGAPPAGVEIRAPTSPDGSRILTPEALSFLAKLHRAFEPRRQELLTRRAERQREFDSGALPDFLRDTGSIRSGRTGDATGFCE